MVVKRSQSLTVTLFTGQKGVTAEGPACSKMLQKVSNKEFSAWESIIIVPEPSRCHRNLVTERA